METDPENWHIINPGSKNLRAGDVFEWVGFKWRAVTNPHGSYVEVGGLKLPISAPYDPEIYTPEVGELTAELLS